MDSDSKKIETNTATEEPPVVLQGFIANVSNVLSTSWVRCTIQADDGVDRFVLGCRRYLLLNFRIFLVVLYITYETLK